MKDILEPFIYPQNIVLVTLFICCLCYRKKGLWALFVFYYLAGNTFIANQVRQIYDNQLSHVSDISRGQEANLIVLGCGGSKTQLPACAKARLEFAASLLTEPNNEGDAPLPALNQVVITTKYCAPYVDYLSKKLSHVAISCFDGGENTYQEFNSLAFYQALDKSYILTSDFHAFRVAQLVKYHGFSSKTLATTSQTFKPVNCSYNCFFTVNLSNFDLYSKLSAELFSYGVFVLTRAFTPWYDSPLAQGA